MAPAWNWTAAGESCGAGQGVGIVRRHLTHALELLPELEAEARKRQMETLKQYASVTPPMGERQSIKGEAIDAAAAVVGVCGKSVQQAKAVNRLAPLLCIRTLNCALLSHVAFFATE